MSMTKIITLLAKNKPLNSDAKKQKQGNMLERLEFAIEQEYKMSKRPDPVLKSV